VAERHKHRGAIVAENRRLKSAVAAIHDLLHRGDVDGAHQACECAMTGGSVSQPSVGVRESASLQDFAARFNALAQQEALAACAVVAIPIDRATGKVSLQLCGNVDVCRVVEELIRGKSSLYMGDHGKAATRG
jgi:hypothetical protein